MADEKGLPRVHHKADNPVSVLEGGAGEQEVIVVERYAVAAMCQQAREVVHVLVGVFAFE